MHGYSKGIYAARKKMGAARIIFALWVFAGFVLIGDANPALSRPGRKATESKASRVRNAGFVCVEGVYNSELMAPYDVLQHTFYRDSTDYIRCFIVTPDGKPFTTFEGIRIMPDYSFQNAPRIDILVIPSTRTSMTADLKNKVLMHWLKRQVAQAEYVITVCDGAFPLAGTGFLDGRTATTFPADRQRLASMFPKVNVKFDQNFVVDGKFITSVGGARSYEPALYLVESLYSKANARRIARGLVLDWDVEKIPHLIVSKR